MMRNGPRGLFSAVLGRPGVLRSLRVSSALMATIPPSDSLAPSSRCYHRVYPSLLSGLTPPRFPGGGHPHLGGGESRGSPKVRRGARYGHTRLTHVTAVSRPWLPPSRRGSPLRCRWTRFAVARVYPLALAPFRPSLSADALGCTTGLGRLHLLSVLLRAWHALLFAPRVRLEREFRPRVPDAGSDPRKPSS